MESTGSKGEPLIPYDPKLARSIRRIMNSQEHEAHRLRPGVEAPERGANNNKNNSNMDEV